MHHCRVLAPWNPKMLSHFSHNPSCCRVTYICHALDICHVCVRIAVSVRIHDRSIFKFRCKSTAIFLTVQFNTSFLVIFFHGQHPLMRRRTRLRVPIARVVSLSHVRTQNTRTSYARANCCLIKKFLPIRVYKSGCIILICDQSLSKEGCFYT